jgi:hypothetical protein
MTQGVDALFQPLCEVQLGANTSVAPAERKRLELNIMHCTCTCRLSHSRNDLFDTLALLYGIVPLHFPPPHVVFHQKPFFHTR